jgi:hypothetical protein
VKVTVSVATWPGESIAVLVPTQLSAETFELGFEQTSKSCGSAPSSVTMNLTVPTGTTVGESVNANSVGRPAATDTVVAADGLVDVVVVVGTAGTCEKTAVTCAPPWTVHVDPGPRQPPRQPENCHPFAGRAESTTWPLNGRSVAVH